MLSRRSSRQVGRSTPRVGGTTRSGCADRLKVSATLQDGPAIPADDLAADFVQISRAAHVALRQEWSIAFKKLKSRGRLSADYGSATRAVFTGSHSKSSARFSAAAEWVSAPT